MSQYIFHAILFSLGFLGTYFMIPLFKSMLVNSNVIRPNYKNEMIPVGMGIVFLPMIIINSIILGFVTLNNIWFVSSSNYNLNIVWLLCLALYIFSMMAMFFAGALDDLIGNRNVSGLKGHFKSLFKGELTTGGFKALFGGFVGLVVPHMMRMLVGPDHRVLLPASALAGAAFLVVCDSLGRIIIPPAEVRVGIMTALLGTPYFLYLLRRMQKQVF